MKKLILAMIFLGIQVFYGQDVLRMSVDKSGQVNPALADGLDMNIQVENLEAPSPDGNSTRSYLLRRKEEVSRKYPRTYAPSGNRTITSEDTIGVGASFMTSRGGIPNDNSMAISDSGILVSAYNSAIYVYDTKADTLMDEISLNFFRDQLGLTAHSFDPKMIYDPNEDRFILVFLIGTQVSNSDIIVCFSSTNNPIDPWSVYSVPGNPLNDTSWSDYPAISITEKDLFITMNLLREGGSWQTSFKQTVIWQIQKQEGYNGDTAIITDLWYNITEGGINLRNMHPVRGGFDIKGPNQYFLSNRNFALQSDSIYLIEVTNSIESASASLNVQLLHANIDYHFAPTARQISGSGKIFQTNDSRVLGGIIENNQIQFVQNSLHPSSGNAAVYHGVITDVNNNPTVTARFIYDDSTEYGYPNIVYGGLIPNEKKAVIGFNHTSLWDLPGHSAIYFDGENYSEVKRVKEGENFVAAQFGSYQRWGDYLGIQRMYSEPCKVWMTGYFGAANKLNYSWASELILPGDCFDTVYQAPQQNGNIFPNPTNDYAEIHFTVDAAKEVTIDLLDRKGQVVKTLFQDKVKAGDNRLTFSTRNLSQGLYFVRVYSESEKILTKKIVKY